MSNDARFVANSIEELLVAMAEGVRDAQEALNAIPATDAFGRALPTYLLPFLDFTIQVSISTTQSAGGRPVTRMLTGAGASTQSSDTRSTISGRFVASPPGEGLPVAQLTITPVATPSLLTPRLRLTARNSAGEILSGQRIELNIDDRASRALSGTGDDAPPPGARLDDAIVITDADGVAETGLVFGGGAPAQTVVVAALLGAVRASAAVVKPA